MDHSALSHTQPLSYTSTYPTIPMHEQEHALQNIPVVPLLPALLPATTSVSYAEQNSVLAAQSSALPCLTLYLLGVTSCLTLSPLGLMTCLTKNAWE